MKKEVWVEGGTIRGDFVQCMECMSLMLVEYGKYMCPLCDSINLTWVDDDRPEIGVADLILSENYTTVYGR